MQDFLESSQLVDTLQKISQEQWILLMKPLWMKTRNYYNIKIFRISGIFSERSSDKKTLAMSHLIQYTRKVISKIPELQNKSLAIGFSDDSISNIESMTLYFMNERVKWISDQENWKEAMIWSSDKIRVYFTGNQDQLCMIPGKGISIEKEDNLTKIVI